MRLSTAAAFAVWGFLLAALAGALHAGEEEVLGGHEGWLDRMGGGIRELSLGNAATASEEAMPASYWNPALLAFNRKTTVGVGADIRSLDRNGGFAGVQGRVAANLGMGIGLLNRGDFNVQAYDRDEKSLGTARPQSIGSYVGLGIKSSRTNAFGAALQWYSSNMDIGDGSGNVNVIGIVNLGWHKRWGEKLRTAVVVRNLGLNEDLSANFDLTTLTGEDVGGFDHTSTDFFPKTLVLAASYTRKLWNRDFEFALEAMDYQLKDALLVVDANFHHQAVRGGVECAFTENLDIRGGVDRGNIALGLGYALPWGRRRLAFDYALLLERGFLTLNPYAVGLRFDL
jgi:hypothetical protein